MLRSSHGCRISSRKYSEPTSIRLAPRKELEDSLRKTRDWGGMRWWTGGAVRREALSRGAIWQWPSVRKSRQRKLTTLCLSTKVDAWRWSG